MSDVIDDKVKEAVFSARALVVDLRHRGYAAVVVFVAVDAAGINGQPVYVSGLPRVMGTELLEHMVQSAKAADTTEFDLGKEIN